MIVLDEISSVLRERRPRLYVVATGAGAGIQQLLWYLPGASKFLVGAAFPYDSAAVEEFLGFWPQRSVDRRTAIALAQESFMRACRGSGEGEPIGLGLTAAVATDRVRRGEDRVCVAVVSPRRSYVFEMNLYGDRAKQGTECDALGLILIYDALVKPRRADESSIEAEMESVLMARPVFFPDGRRGLEPEKARLLYPGSFDPLHEGHKGIVNEGMKTYPFIDWTLNDCYFNLTMDAVHKPPLSAAEVLRRAAQFRHQGAPLLVTRGDPLYLLKARRFPGATFVLGADALVRMLEPEWFDGVIPEYAGKKLGSGIRLMLHELRELGSSFVVFDRMVDGKLLTLADASVPAEFETMFSRVEKHWCVSSSELRAHATEKR